MRLIDIEDVPLQDYLLGVLVAEPGRPDQGALLDRIDRRSGGHLTFGAAVKGVRDHRGQIETLTIG